MVRGLFRLTFWHTLLGYFILLASMGSVCYYYWKAAPMDNNYISSVYEVSEIIEDLSKSEYLTKTNQLVSNDHTKDAIRLMSQLEQKVNQVHGLKSADRSIEKLNESTKGLKKSLLKLISYPQTASVIRILDSKIEKFREFVVLKEWQSLARISGKLRNKTFDFRDYTLEMLKLFYRSMIYDITTMKNIVEGSELTLQDKNNVTIRLQSIQVELNILQNIISDREIYFENQKKFENAFNLWLAEITPAVTLEKINIGHKNRNLAMSLIGIFAIIIILMGMHIFMHKKNSKQAMIKIEESFLKMVKNNIVANRPLENVNCSQKFKSEVEKIHAYVQKRLSYSTIFNTALPFASILLDSNLKVVWANEHFCKTFKLDNFDFDQKSLSWDYLLRFTNLGENDPVIEALQNEISGIYQILIKVDQNSSAFPYEMYVSPVHHENKKNVMIFFYSLSSMQEIIKNQGLTLVDPIKRTLEALIRQEFTREFQNQVNQDFELVGIKEIFQKFVTYFDFITNQRKGLLSEIDKLENILSDHYKIMMDMVKKNEDFKNEQETFHKNLKGLKQSLVTLVDINHEYEDINFNLLDVNKNLLIGYGKAVESIKGLYEKICSGQKTIGEISLLKNEFKTIKSNLHLLYSRVLQSHDQLLIFEKSDHVDKNKLEQGLSKMKTDIKAVEREIQILERLTTNLDIHVSKEEMILQLSGVGVDDDVIESHQIQLLALDQDIENGHVKKTGASQEAAKLEDLLVKQMQLIIDHHRENTLFQKSIHHLMSVITIPAQHQMNFQEEIQILRPLGSSIGSHDHNDMISEDAETTETKAIYSEQEANV